MVKEIAGRLATLLDVPSDEMEVQIEPSSPEHGFVPDLVVKAGDRTLVVEFKTSGSAAPVAAAAEQVRRYATVLGEGVIPLVAVPYMGDVGRERCKQAGVGWLDLSGNARITAPGLQVHIEGKPNRFKRPGRPSSAFAPKSARISRWLLLHAGHPATQREIAEATGMDEGFTSRIVARLEEDALIIREPDGRIRARDPDMLLDAWGEVYDFSKHDVLRGHIAARSGQSLLRRLADDLAGHGIRHAATGLAGAWLLTRFAGFRTVTVYVHEPLTPSLLERIGFREELRGSNVWLVVPNDEGVLHGALKRDGVQCVHPVQVYLDLKGQPERSKEAAGALRAELLTWKADA
jgi:hypothetical protein